MRPRPKRTTQPYYFCRDIEEWAKEAETEMDLLKLINIERELALSDALVQAKLLLKKWFPFEASHWKNFNKDAPTMRIINKALKK